MSRRARAAALAALVAATTAAAAFAPACDDPARRTASPPRAPARDDAAPAPGPPARDASGPDARAPAVVGVLHEELLRRHADAGADAPTDDELAPPGGALAPDLAFADEAPVRIVRARYTVSFPDERVTIQTERALRVDDQGDRASVALVGTGLPAVPGMRVAARAGLLGFALVSPEGSRYRVAPPDELQRWFTGANSRAGNNLAFRRTDSPVVAARGSLTLVIHTERRGDLHPLTCRALVAMFLGGDPAAARVGCANARMPTRAALYARGWHAVAVDLAEAPRVVEVPRAVMAVPPAGAAADLPPPSHEANGAFFAPTELASLGGTRRPEHILTVESALTREALVFVDDLAIGWVAPGATAQFVGMSSGRHVVRARSFDGIERTRNANATFPGTVRLENSVQ